MATTTQEEPREPQSRLAGFAELIACLAVVLACVLVSVAGAWAIAMWVFAPFWGVVADAMGMD